MSLGTPGESSRVGGIPEVVEHQVDGILVEPADLTGLAEALKRTPEDRTLRGRVGPSGKFRCEQEFELQSRIDQFVGRLERVWAAI